MISLSSARCLIFIFLFSFFSFSAHAKTQKPLQCLAFSPYVGNLSPNGNQSIPQEHIENLINVLIKKTPFRCIMTYGVLNGLEHIFPIAEKNKLKVISILWIDKNKKVNDDSIAHGIALARQFPETIIKLSCGSEVRTRHDYQFDGEVMRCLDALKEAKVPQPIGVIDTWWEWCNRTIPCHQNFFSDKVEWIGINVFPWWENKHSGLYSCIDAQHAANFHLARMTEIQKTHPNKEIILTEFGWPNFPENATEIHQKTGEHCGIANVKNQQQVINLTFKKLAEKKWSGVAFEAFSENWKQEDDIGKGWGICQSTLPYDCVKLTH